MNGRVATTTIANKEEGICRDHGPIWNPKIGWWDNLQPDI